MKEFIQKALNYFKENHSFDGFNEQEKKGPVWVRVEHNCIIYGEDWNCEEILARVFHDKNGNMVVFCKETQSSNVYKLSTVLGLLSVPKVNIIGRLNALNQVPAWALVYVLDKYKNDVMSANKLFRDLHIKTGSIEQFMKYQCSQWDFYCETPRYRLSQDCTEIECSSAEVGSISLNTLLRRVETGVSNNNLHKDFAKIAVSLGWKDMARFIEPEPTPVARPVSSSVFEGAYQYTPSTPVHWVNYSDMVSRAQATLPTPRTYRRELVGWVDSETSALYDTQRVIQSEMLAIREVFPQLETSSERQALSDRYAELNRRLSQITN